MTCKELMTPDPACCLPGDTVVTAAMLMKSHDIGSVPVISDRDSRMVIGMITDRDIALRVVAEQREYYNTRVENIMSTDVVTCKATDDYDEVIAAMKHHRLRRVPVVDASKRLVGIIAQADVAREVSEHEEVGHMVEQISRPGMPERHEDGRSSRYTKTGLLVAGGLGIGAGLIYLLDPRWARRARESVATAAGNVRDTVGNAADSLRETVGQISGSQRPEDTFNR